MSRFLVATWAPGGNLPPLLAAARVLAARGHDVRILGSNATRPAADEAGLEVVPHDRAGDPDTDAPFERQADTMMATAASPEIAADVRALIDQSRPDALIADCMLPAALVAADASGVPSASLVHFLYGRGARCSSGVARGRPILQR